MQGEGGAHVMVISSGQYNITTLTVGTEISTK